MAITISEAAYPLLIIIPAAVAVTIGVAYSLCRIDRDLARDSAEVRDKIIRDLKDRLARSQKDREAATTRHTAAVATICELNEKIDKVAAIFGWEDVPDDEGGGASDGDEPTPAAGPAPALYACVALNEDDPEEYCAYLVRGSSYDEAYGKAHRIAQEKYPDGCVVEVASAVLEPRSAAG